MSRAIWMSVAMVSGLSALVSSAQAASVLATKPAPTTKLAPAAMPRDSRSRRVRPLCWLISFIVFLPWMIPARPSQAAPLPSFEPSAALQHLDLVAVRVGHEEELADKLAVGGEFHDLAGAEALGGEARVLGVEVLDQHGEVAVAIAEVIGLGAALVDGEFHLEGAFVVGHVDEGEFLEVEPVGHLEPERALVEINRPRLVENADHAVNGFGHHALRIVAVGLESLPTQAGGRVVRGYYRVWRGGFWP